MFFADDVVLGESKEQLSGRLETRYRNVWPPSELKQDRVYKILAKGEVVML